MKILITGGAGYIGSHTCVEMLKLGHEITVIDNLSNSNAESLNRVRQITGRDLTFYEADVRDEEKLDGIFSKHMPDCVIHFAGLKSVGESVSMPIEYYSNNLMSTITLCRVMKKHSVKGIVFSSSATVYRADSEMPVSETAPLGCINPYGWTKFMCEQILRDAAFADPQMSVILLRYFNPVGAHESGMIGEYPAGIPNNLFPYITQTAIGKHEKLYVYGNDYDTSDGTGVRDYIHVVDLAQGHAAALAYAMTHRGCEEINLGTGRGYSVLDMVSAFERVNHVKVPYVFAPRRPGDLASVYANPEKARRILGWHAGKTLDDMCADAWRWQKQNPNGYLTVKA